MTLFIILTITTCSSDNSKKEKPIDPALNNITGNEKTLIIYYTHSGNAKQMASIMHKKLKGDYVELKTVEPYPESYNEILE